MNISDYQGKYIHKSAHHLYIAPAEELQDMIAHYTITFSGELPVMCEYYHILPDASGCLIFQKENLDYWGAMSELVLQKNDLDKAEERFFVEFLPGGLYQLSAQHQQQHVNKRGTFASFDAQLDQDLRNIYQKANDYETLIATLNDYFLAKKRKHEIPSTFSEIVQTINNKQGNTTMQEIAEYYQISLRKLLRDFHKYIGLSGKEYANIVRVNHLLKYIREDSLTMTAMQSGFFDQSHFNKLFKQITKTTPTHYLVNLSDFYNEMYKF